MRALGPEINRDKSNDLYRITYFGLFPLINALADFASLGLTLFLLRRGLGGRAVFYGLCDVLGGLVIFAALILGLISHVHFIRFGDGTALVDLPTLFADLRDPARRGAYFWLFLMLFSTLLPTLLHAAHIAGTVVIHMLGWFRHYLIACLDHPLESVRRRGILLHAALRYVTAWLVVIAAYGVLFKLGHGQVIAWLIEAAALCARAIGVALPLGT